MCIYFFFAVVKYPSRNELIYLLARRICKEVIYMYKSVSAWHEKRSKMIY